MTGKTILDCYTWLMVLSNGLPNKSEELEELVEQLRTHIINDIEYADEVSK